VLGLVLGLGSGGGPGALADEIHPSKTNAYQMVSGDTTEDDRQKWDTLYSTKGYVYGKEPSAFLQETLRQLPMGKVLDIAMGEGRNAVFMASKGFQVDGVDISDVALRKARRLAREHRVKVHLINADLNSYVIRPNTYDVILNIDYLQRSLIPQIKQGLKTGGMVVFENAVSPQTPKDFVLQKDELKQLFKDFEILIYREEGGKARLLAKKI